MSDTSVPASPAAPVAYSALDALVVLSANWRMLVLAPLLAGVVAVGASFLVPRTFTAEAMLLPPAQQGSSLASLAGALGGGAAALVGSTLPGLKDPNDQWIAMLRSRVVADALLDRFDLVRLYGVNHRFEARRELGENTRIDVTRQGMISLRVDDHDPQRAQAMAQAYIDELQKLSNAVAVTAAAKRRAFFERQLADASLRLGQAEAELKSVGVQSDVLKTSPQATVEAIADVQRSILALEVQISGLRATFTESSAPMQQAQARLAQLRSRLATLQSAQPAPARPAAAPANGPRTVETPAAEATAADQSYVARYRAFKYAELVFESIARQLELARLEEAREGTLVQVVDPPMVPEWKSKPRRAVVGLVTTLGTLVALLIGVLLRERWHGLRASPDEAARADRIVANLRLRRR